jgi:hypothetical protein
MQTRVAIAAHHQQVCTELVALRDQHVGNVVVLADCAVFYGIDAMVLEVMHRVIALQRVRLRWVPTFRDEDAHLTRLMQIGEGFGERARRLPATVPCQTTLSNGAMAFQSSGTRKR